MGAHFSHCQHDIAGRRFEICGVARHKLLPFDSNAKDVAHGGGERGFGHVRQRFGDADHRPDTSDIGQRHQKRRLRLHAAKNAHDLRLRPCRGGCALAVRKQRGERGIRIAVEQADQARRVCLHQIAKIRRSLGNTAKNAPELRMAPLQCSEGFPGALRLDARKPRSYARAGFVRWRRQHAGEAADQ